MFTQNNYTPEQIAEIDQWVAEEKCQYVAYSKETGASGTPHLQGHVKFKLQKTLGAVRALLPKAHWETMKGTWAQSDKYINKETKATEHGTLFLTNRVEWDERRECPDPHTPQRRYRDWGVCFRGTSHCTFL